MRWFPLCVCAIARSSPADALHWVLLELQDVHVRSEHLLWRLLREQRA